MTLGELWLFEGFLEKVIQLGWFGTPTNYSLFSFDKLEMEKIRDHSGFWMKIILNFFYASNIVLVSNLFLQIFCKKILILLIIIPECYSWLSKLIVFWCPKFLSTSWSITFYWNGISRKDMYLNQLDVYLYNSNI